MTIEALLKIKLKILLYSGPIVVLGAILYLSAGPSPSEVDRDQWIEISPAPLINHIALAGKIEPYRTLAISAPFEGEIQECLVEPGQKVELGQPLLIMDPTLLEAQLRESLANLLKAERAAREVRNWHSGKQVIKARRGFRAAQIRLQNLQRQLNESKALFERGIIARTEVDDLQQQVESQNMELASAKEEVEQVLAQGDNELLQIAEMELTNAKVKHQILEKNLAERILIAPFAGVVVSAAFYEADEADNLAPVRSGSKVSQGKVLFGLADVERLKIISEVSELDINKLHPGQAVEVFGDGFDGRLSGTLESVSNHAAPHDNTDQGAKFAISLVLAEQTPEQLQGVRLGMSVKLKIITYKNTEAIIVPAMAINTSNDTPTLNYRASLLAPEQQIRVIIGQAVPQGVEVFGVKAGFVRLSL